MGWLLAIILAILLYRARRELNSLRSQVETSETESVGTTGSEQPSPSADLGQPLTTLHLQLRRMLEDGVLEEADYRQLTDKIDACWVSEQIESGSGARGELWWSSCQTGWDILTANGLIACGPPPWRPVSPPLATTESESETVTDIPKSVQPPLPAAPAEPKSSSEPVMAPPVRAGANPEKGSAQPRQRSPQAHPGKSPQQPAAATASVKHAWHPVEPGRVELALRAVSGWPKMLVPILVQNIGWFIGAFLFLAGTVFLVTYTTGYAKAAIVSASLFGYAVFLTWSGYKLLRSQPRLATASTVLLFTGLLLVPLSISAITRLFMNASGSLLLWGLGLAAAAACLLISYKGSQFVAGVIHRALRGGYPRVFLALASVQLVAPLVAYWPSWLSLALAHLLILGLFAYGFVRLAHQWLHSVFVDNKKILFFAGGALLFAALTSFVHITWGVSAVSLPAGYYAPYLLLLCGLLFYLDAQFKVQIHRYAFLSRLTFLIYGLSIVAVLLALNAPVARLVTLTMATGLYALVVWKYLTLVPLYLMLASLSALYAFAVLAHFPAAAHFLLAIPGLFALHSLSRWAGARGGGRPAMQARGLSQLCLVTYRGTLLLLVALAAWSLSWGGPSLPAMISAVVLALGLWWLLRAGPGPILVLRSARIEGATAGIESINHLEGPWLYAPIAAVSLVCFFAPRTDSLSWATQGSLGVMLAASIWTALLVVGRRSGARRLPKQTETLANSALLSVLVGSVLAVLPMPHFEIHGLTIGALGVGAGVLLALSLNLYARWLFYLFLAWGGATAAALKMTYFAGPSLGLSEILVAAALWGFLWWLDRQPDELSSIARERAWKDAPARLVWLLPSTSSGTGYLDPEHGTATVAVNRRAGLRGRVAEPRSTVAAMDEACV